MTRIVRPFYPIIYVRGYAMTEGEIRDTVATPYMGFNLGSMKIRQNYKGKVTRHVFESPLVRLMKDYGYYDNYKDGLTISGALDPKSIIIHRYYDQADPDLGRGKVPSIQDAARGLSALIEQVRRLVLEGNPENPTDFRVYLVAHSMGGLVCRCLLQNPDVDVRDARQYVDKVFTYATPHNGIDMAGINVPRFLGIWDLNNFNREKIAEYLAIKGHPDRVDTLDGKFDPDRFFCMIGTNYKDYDVACGLSRTLAGEMSDGLVRIRNASVNGAPRAYAHRSHSGHYGIVNSEEGYQNLVRFLFGDVRIDGYLEVDNLPLPPNVLKKYKAGKQIRASYFFEASVTPRSAKTYWLTERRKEMCSAVLREFDDMLKPAKSGLNAPRWPVLFSVCLDKKKVKVGNWIVFCVELTVSTTDYEIDGFLWNDRRIEGEYLFRNTIVVRAKRDGDNWDLRYLMTDDAWGENPGKAVERDEVGYFIPCESAKGFKAKLRLNARKWE